VYRFRLYREPGAALDHVFDHEVPAFQRWRSTPLGLQPSSLALLQDKVAFADELGRRGVPVVPTGACVPKHAGGRPLAAEMQAFERVFCKARSGSRGQGAFTAWRTPHGIEGKAFEGHAIRKTEALESKWQELLALDDALIQPCLATHPALAQMACGDQAVTVRFISRWQGASLSCLSATLEIPAGSDESSGRTLYSILPIEADSGRLLPLPADALLTREARERAERTWARAGAIETLPYWAALTAASFRAHRVFPGVWAIAWDWVITPDGPLLLEGNTGWGTATPQILQGGLLSASHGDLGAP
jgi:hypothetical protein